MLARSQTERALAGPGERESGSALERAPSLLGCTVYSRKEGSLMRTRNLLALLVIAPLAVVACSRSQPPQEEHQEAASSMPPAIDVGTRTLDLQPMEGSDVTGTVSVSQTADTIMVKVDLEHLLPGDDYAVRIYHGTCESQGPEATALTAVHATVEGGGSSTTMVPISELGETPAENGHEGFFIQVSRADETRAACVDLPTQGGETEQGAGEPL
jgi:hypothetical protein